MAVAAVIQVVVGTQVVIQPGAIQAVI